MMARSGALLALVIAACGCDRGHSTTKSDSIVSETAAARTAPGHVAASSMTGAAGAANPRLTPAPAAEATQVASSRFAVTWARTMELSALKDVQRQLTAEDPGQFGELEHEGEVSRPANCMQWSSLHAKGFEAVSEVEAQPDRGALIRCGTLSLLQKAQPAQTSHIRDMPWDTRLLALLPSGIATAPSAEARQRLQAATNAGRTFAQYDPQAVAKPGGEPHSLEIREGGGLTMIILHAEAWGDFDGDGRDDVVVSVINGATRGTSSTARLLTLTRSSATEPLRIVASRQ